VAALESLSEEALRPRAGGRDPVDPPGDRRGPLPGERPATADGRPGPFRQSGSCGILQVGPQSAIWQCLRAGDSAPPAAVAIEMKPEPAARWLQPYRAGWCGVKG